MRSASVLTISEFKGQSSNSPRGTVMAPELLLNANLDRTGGYSPMFSRSRRVTNVTRAVYAARADNLFLEQSGAVNYWDVQASTFTAISGATSLVNTVNVMPDVLLAEGGARWVTTEFTQSSTLSPGTVSDTGTPTIKWSYVDKTASTESFLFEAAIAYTLLIEWIPTKAYPLGGVTSFTVGAGTGTPPAKFSIQLEAITADGETPHFNIYGSQSARPPQLLRSNYDTTANPPQYVALLELKGVEPLPNPGYIQHPWLAFAVTAQTATTYHKGRAFIAPVSASYYEINTDALKWEEFGTHTLKIDTEPTRLYFSEITADGRKVLPRFSLLNFIDVPFRVSRRIIAFASVGPYLYIFGDRELLVMTGDPATDAQIENIGDSIGAISPGSVQQLSGVVFWQSDSGVMAVQGASVKEVGQDVRDALLALGLNVSTTVDFKREQYIITDGTTILAYHAREGGWTQRSVEVGSGTPSMIYGGGTPYMQQGTTLYSIGGESGIDGAPPRMQMRVRWPRYELGSWLNRKVFDGLCVGMDLATQSATINNLTTVDADTLLESDTTLTVTPGNRGAKLHTIKDGVGLQGVTISVELTVDSQDTRAILRPPLVVYGSMSGEEDWFDNGI